MQDRAGGVDDANMAGPALSVNATFNPLDNRLVVDSDRVTVSYLSAKLIENGAALFDDVVPIVTAQ